MHDRAPASRNRRRNSTSQATAFHPIPEAGESSSGRAPDFEASRPQLGIPDILGRRARWVGARLRQGGDLRG